MKPVQINVKLIDITERADGKMESAIVLEDLRNQNIINILVDESCSRVKTRLLEQYNGDERHGVFLSRGMINININTYTDIWDINQEDWNWYTFAKSDVRNMVEV